jgi:hypothetical protein
MPAERQVMAKQINRDKAQPFSVRLTKAEKALLQDKAGSVPLGTFIRNFILAKNVKPRVGRRQYPIKDSDALGRVLGLLGRSRLANNLNQLAKAANIGALPVTAETEADIRQACADIRSMRQALMLALGVTAQDSSESACGAFSRHAGGLAR